MRRFRERSALNAEINVVSLIDVMMLLMVIFMITAPMMQGGVDVALPTGEARPLEPKSGLVVTVDRAGGIFVDGTPMSYVEFRGAFKALQERKGKQGVYLQADSAASYGRVARVLAVMQRAGASNVGIVMEQEPVR
ncbi:MAG TPA: biopolymer transporter ExbD [Gemmatimonadaceae bacterium]|nr:biopolymer transporter ExbD [Gemmatimonadaceae bacterium]